MSPPPTSLALQAGQTIMFLGDHTSPDAPGYLLIVREVLARFRPGLGLNLISAGSDRQTASGLASRALLDILTTSRPNWISLRVGLAEAAREPDLATLIREYNARRDAAAQEADPVIGIEHSPEGRVAQPIPGNGHPPAGMHHSWRFVSDFQSSLSNAVESLLAAGVRPILHTPVAVGDDLIYPLNIALRAYGRAIREIAGKITGPALIDDERAFRAVLDRAATYKQQVSLADWNGKLNQQGEALMARTFLGAFGLLPG